MVGSIDPRCETVRGTHWPKKGRVVVWNSRRGNHLGQRSKVTASTGRTYGCKRSDQTLKNSCGTGAVHIWMQAIRSDPQKLLWHGGRPHMSRSCKRRQMVGSIDPRCETVRGTHWPVKVAGVFGARVAENHLGQRSKVTAST